MDSVIIAKGLTKRYGGRAVVDGLSLSVDQGEIYGFLGLNGAGKTTTIRMLLGMSRPSSGRAYIFGSEVRAGAWALWARVGYLVETPHAYPELTVRENLEVFRRLRRMQDRCATDRVLERLGLGPYADQRASTLSLGNAQRLGLAKALLHEPEVLILDEPANGLDPAGIVEIRDLLLDLASGRGTTILMSSHILSEVSRLTTKIGIVHEGRLIEEALTADLARRRRRWLVLDARDRLAAKGALQAAGLVSTTRDDGSLLLTAERAVECPDEVAQVLVTADVPPTRLSVEQENLEAHFLRLVGAPRGVTR